MKGRKDTLKFIHHMCFIQHVHLVSCDDAGEGAVQPQFINKEMSERLGSGERG